MPRTYTNGKKYIKGSNLFFIAESLKVIVRNRHKAPISEVKIRLDALWLLGVIEGVWGTDGKITDALKPEKMGYQPKRPDIDIEKALKRLAQGGDQNAADTTDSPVVTCEGIREAVDA